MIGGPDEQAMVSGAIRTDFILSAEIMVIALDEVASEPLLSRTITLVIVAIAMTLLVYGVVALIVKMDDVGLHLATRRTGWLAGLGRGLVAAMPKVLATLSTVGIIAMLWVGGHILLVGLNDLGWHAPYELVHHGEEAISHAVPGVVGSALAWLLNTAASALLGVIAGAIVVAVMHMVHRITGKHDGGHGEPPSGEVATDGAPIAPATDPIASATDPIASATDPVATEASQDEAAVAGDEAATTSAAAKQDAAAGEVPSSSAGATEDAAEAGDAASPT